MPVKEELIVVQAVGVAEIQDLEQKQIDTNINI